MPFSALCLIIYCPCFRECFPESSFRITRTLYFDGFRVCSSDYRSAIMTILSWCSPLPSTRSPFVTLLSWRTQPARRTSFRETGVVHRITFTFSYFLFTCVLFINFILDIINGVLYLVKLLDHFLGNWHSLCSVLPYTPHSYATESALDC